MKRIGFRETLFFVAGILGTIIVYETRRTPKMPPEIPAINDNRAVGNLLDPSTLAELERLRSRKAEFEKSEQLLEKSLLALLASIGLRAEGIKVALPDSTESAARAASKQEKAKSYSKPLVDSRDAEAFEAARTVQDERRPRSAESIASEDEKNVYLKESVLKDVNGALNDSRPFSSITDELRELSGSFSGDLFLFNGRRDQVTLLLRNLREEEDSISGRYELTLTREGESKPYSRSSGRGNLKQVVQGPSSTGIFLRGSEDELFQVYYFKELDQISGNYYLKDGKNRWKSMGMVSLNRRR